GAVYLVSSAEPGILDMVKESFAGSKAFADAPEVRDVLRGGGMPQLPKGSPQEIEQGVLAALTESQAILAAKGPDQLNGFRAAITDALTRVADAAGGTSEKEAAAAAKVKAAIGA